MFSQWQPVVYLEMTVASSVVCVLGTTFGWFYGNSNNTMTVKVSQILTILLLLSWATCPVSETSYISTFTDADFDRNVTHVPN